ncbi:MAG: hypothetical protein KatS3mg077_2016 [Candidatus Binatia bacterium]|nr:MAG: hypothetical protein KatS3mg077_2016 [Candidatus Binatia bacterium]
MRRANDGDGHPLCWPWPAWPAAAMAWPKRPATVCTPVPRWARCCSPRGRIGRWIERLLESPRRSGLWQPVKSVWGYGTPILSRDGYWTTGGELRSRKQQHLSRTGEARRRTLGSGAPCLDERYAEVFGESTVLRNRMGHGKSFVQEAGARRGLEIRIIALSKKYASLRSLVESLTTNCRARTAGVHPFGMTMPEDDARYNLGRTP